MNGSPFFSTSMGLLGPLLFPSRIARMLDAVDPGAVVAGAADLANGGAAALGRALHVAALGLAAISAGSQATRARAAGTGAIRANGARAVDASELDGAGRRGSGRKGEGSERQQVPLLPKNALDWRGSGMEWGVAPAAAEDDT